MAAEYGVVYLEQNFPSLLRLKINLAVDQDLSINTNSH